MTRQLTIDGGEVEASEAVRSTKLGWSPARRAIFARLQEHGSIRSVEAGVIVHRFRSAPCGLKGTGSAMWRIAKRGAARRGGHPGLWLKAAEDREEA